MTNAEDIIRDRALNPWRIPLTPKARNLISTVRSMVEEYENTHHPRSRQRTEDEYERYISLIASLTMDATYHRVSHQRKAIRVPRDYHALKRTIYQPDHVRTPLLPKMVDWMDALKILEQAKQQPGRPTPLGRRHQSTIVAGSKLDELILSLGITMKDIGSDYRLQEIVIIKRDKEDTEIDELGALVEYEDNDRIKVLRDEIREINEWLAKANLTLLPTRQQYEYNGVIDIRERHCRRIYTCGDIEHGGRLFGGFWQGMKKAHRREALLINDLYTEERDYSSMMPRLLYGYAGATIPKELEHDLYAIPGFERSRDGIKKVFNAMLFGRNPKRWREYPGASRDGSKGAEELFHPSERPPIQTVVRAIMTAHYPVREHFGTRIGHKLQNLESNILVAVLLELKRRGIVALPIHDALIVAHEDARDAEEVMERVFRSVVGIDARVSVH